MSDDARERERGGDQVGGDKAGRDKIGRDANYYYTSPELTAINVLINRVGAVEARLADRELISGEQMQGMFTAVRLLSEEAGVISNRVTALGTRIDTLRFWLVWAAVGIGIVAGAIGVTLILVVRILERL